MAIRGPSTTPSRSRLFKLLRLEAGATERWEGAPSAWNVERTLSPERLARLDACVPAPGPDGLLRALGQVAALGREVCAAVAESHGWPWPAALAQRTVALVQDAEA